MPRRRFWSILILALSLTLLAACQQAIAPNDATLTVDVDPDDAMVTVVRADDGTLVHQGVGDVTLHKLRPGAYLIIAGEGEDAVTKVVTLGTANQGAVVVEISARRGAPGDDGGCPGGGSGGGGGGGGGGSGGCGDDTGGKGGDYADLLVLYRSEHGVPIVTGPWETEHGLEYCVQPITTEPVPNPYFLLNGTAPEFLAPVVNPVDGRLVTLIPLFADYPEFMVGSATVSLAGVDTIDAQHKPGEEDEGGEACDPLVLKLGESTTFSYGTFATEVELERLNLARAPDQVLARHLLEVAALLTDTDPMDVGLDAAGRPSFDGVAIDAMPKLQAVREALLETGTLPGAGAPYPFPFQLLEPSQRHWSTWELSAFALGGAASKFGSVNVDIVSYHDRLMSIPADMTAAPGWPKGVHTSTELGESFVDYSGFSYNRAATFPGCVVVLDPANWTAGFSAQRLLDVVPFGMLTPKQDNLAGYAQMADDARAVIYYIHLYESVIAYADPVGMNSWVTCIDLAGELNRFD